ncbi:glycosyltransferase family 2 protein, partial [Mesorhizobium sp. M8A.F.Ca.ET.208.01.1.1]
VLFLDADDYLYPHAISEVLGEWDAAVAQAQFRLHLVDEDQQIKDVFPPPEQPFDSGDVVPELLRKGRYHTTVTSGLAFDREALATIMPVPERD